MSCPTAIRFHLDAVAQIPMDDVAALAQLAFHPALLLADHPAQKQFRQAVSIRKYERTKAIWQNAEPCHAAIFRNLQIDRDDPASFYAAYPFRLAKLDGQHVIIAAIGCPAVGDEREPDTLVHWNPKTGKYGVVGDPQPQVIAPDHPADEAHIFGDFFAFARAWVERRAAFYQRRQDQLNNQWVHPVTEPKDGNLPGYLVVGDIAKVRMPRDLPAVLTATGLATKALNAAIFRAANLPRVNENIMRVAA